ncbi:TPA_asm: L [Pueraria betacytorhabdovirus 1]|nr:TPA_asm: L [Pueraria betacytorhabdovirus 1]
MDVDDIFGLGYSSSSSIGSESFEDWFNPVKRDYFPGLSDYHLRSAIKEVNLDALLNKKGRFREGRDLERFFRKFPNATLKLEPPARLLGKILNAGDKLFPPKAFGELRRHQHKFLMHIRDCIITRVRMEINRDDQGGSRNDYDASTCRELILGSIEEEDFSTRYSLLRNYMELMIQIVNNINSMRKRHPNSNMIGEWILDDEDSETLFFSSLGGFDIVTGGDIFFIKSCQSGSSVEEIDIKHAGDMDDLLKPLWRSQNLTSDEFLFKINSAIFPDQGWYVYSTDVLKMICDKVSERDIVLRTSRLFSSVFEPIYPAPEILLKNFLIGDVLLLDLGNDGYRVIKCYEAIYTGVLLRRCQNLIVNNQEFLDTTLEDLRSEHPRHHLYAQCWARLAHGIPHDHHLSQLYGLYRLWGHPMVDSLSGIKKVKRLGTQKKEINVLYSIESGRVFLEKFFLSFKRKWGRYPVFRLSIIHPITTEQLDERERYLINTLRNNEPFRVDNDLYNRADWDFVVVEKTLDLPETFNLTMVIDDKAISPPRRSLIDVSRGLKRMMDPYERRGVLKWMNEDFYNCKEFLTEIEKNGLPHDDCVIGLYPKERELNHVPRMFSLMSAKMRNYIVVTEHMLADDILPHFPQVTMTDDLLSLTKKIYSTTRKQSKNTLLRKGKKQKHFSISVCLNMDFEKWNLNMRRDATRGVFTQLGRLYGLDNLFNVTYDIFNSSFIYLCDERAQIGSRFSLDRQEYELDHIGDYSYDGHVGGFEGLRQKGWTIFTVVVISMILDKFNVNYKLMGQGDNQVLLLTLKTNHVDDDGVLTPAGITELTVLLNDIISSLEYDFLNLGLPLKTLESWRSENFFLYGKFPVKDGVPLSMSLKKLSRAFPFSNEDSMTIDNVLGSSFTNAQSAAMSDVSHIVPYYAGLIEVVRGAYMMTTWHPFTGETFFSLFESATNWFTFENVQLGDASRSKKIIIQLQSLMSPNTFSEALALFPKSLGMSNGMTEYEFLMRGFPDNQTRDLTYLIEIADANRLSDDKSIKTIVSVIDCVIRLTFSESLNLDFLIEDPCAINLKQPYSPKTLLRKRIKSVLSSTQSFKNKNFLQLFELSNDTRKRELLIHLAGSDQLFPRVLHDCYAASLFGFVDGIVSKVDKTVTVQRMCLSSSNEDIIKQVITAENNCIRYLMWRVTSHRETKYIGEPSMSCPTNYIRWARNFGWKKTIEGVTVPYPSHTFVEEDIESTRTCSENSHITCSFSDFTPSDMKTLTSTLGNSPPYLGSYTKEKIRQYDRVALYSSEPLLRRVIKLLRLIGWGNLEDSNLQKYLVNLLDSLCDVDPDIFLVNKEDIGGSIEHRYRDAALKHGALASSMYGLGTWLHLSTDTLEEYSKGSKNVTLHFQAILCWVQSKGYEKILNRCHDGNDCSKTFHYHIKCRECIKSVEYEIPDIPDIPLRCIPCLKDNPYCYTENILLSELDRSVYRSSQKLSFERHTKVSDLQEHDKEVLFHEYWGSQIVNDIISSNNFTSEVSESISELNRYPRIAFLRISVTKLFEMMIILLLLWRLRLDAETDIDNKTSLSTTHAMIRIRRMIISCDKKAFVGLSVLFSWNDKIEEIMYVTGIRMPDSICLGQDEAQEASRQCLLAFIDSMEVLDPSSCFSNYVNLSSSVSLETSLLMRYMIEFSAFDSSYCCDCKRTLLRSFNSDILYNMTGSEKCHKQHIFFDREFVVKTLKVICIQEDVLSKSISQVPVRNTRKVFRLDSGELNEIANRMRKLCPMSSLFSQSSVSFSDCKEIKEGERIFSGIPNYMRTFYRCLDTNMSVGYRIWDIIVGLKISVFENNYKILCLGDGSGSSGRVLNLLTKCKIITSTLVDCSAAYPQTFPSSRPSNQYGLEESNFDNQLSKLYVNDIFSDAFVGHVRKKIKDSGTKFCFCDIEIEHEEFKKFSKTVHHPYSILVEKIRETGIYSALIKVRISSNLEMYSLVEISSRLFETLSIYVTPFCNSEKMEWFVLLTKPKDIYEDNLNSVLHESTRWRLLSMMENYSMGTYFTQVSRKYYLLANKVLLDGGVYNALIKSFYEFFGKKRLNLTNMHSFTKLFFSIGSTRNPKGFVHHTDVKEKYEYESDLKDLGSKIFLLGLALIDSDVIRYDVMNKSHEFILCRPAHVVDLGGEKVVMKYTYEIVRRRSLQSRRHLDKKLNYTHFPAINIDFDENSRRYLPIAHVLAMKEKSVFDITEVDRIAFLYNRGRSDPINTICLPISKTASTSLLSR